MRLKLIITIILILSAYILLTDKEDNLEDEKPLITIGAGAINNLYYLIAQGITELINRADINIHVNTEATRGSVYNMNAMRQSSFQLSLVQGDIAYYAYHGINIPSFKKYPIDNIRSLAVLYPEVVHIVTPQYSSINSITDLKNKRVFIGNNGSGTEQNAIQILSAYGLTLKDIRPISGTDVFGIEQIKNNRIDAMFYVSGLDNTIIDDIAKSTPITFISVQAEQLTSLLKQYPFYSVIEIPANTYNRINQATLALSMKSILVVDNTFDKIQGNENFVTEVLHALFDNIHSFKNISPVLENFDLQYAVADMSIPLHCDAVAFYRQHNIDVPVELAQGC